MSWILHFSDPHLGPVSPGQTLDDIKVAVPREDVETTQRVFRRTLASLRDYVERYDRPDAVVVSGDLSYRAHQDGFEDFRGLLDEYADILPGPDHIVVVPGNHDVVWDTSPGTAERYEGFLGATRSCGCSTPLLDGVDFIGTAGAATLVPAATNSPHVVEHEDFLIIPLNSSNWCGAHIDVHGGWSSEEWAEKLAPLGEGRDAALAQLARLRQQDIARVAPGQFEALRELFRIQGLSLDRRGDPRPRIAVLHHQLLPVSTRLELKPFESLVDLGLVRQALADFGVDVVLHGHKHESGIYWDFTRRATDPIMLERRTLVIASAGHFEANHPVMRALVFEGNPRARNVCIRTFNGVDAATAKPNLGRDVTLPLWLGSMECSSAERTVLRGSTTHDVYARTCAHFELTEQNTLTNIVCEVADASDAETLPPEYPETGFSDRDRWFTDLVSWWQLPHSRLVREGHLSFNHGERIRSRWEDQVERAARMLSEKKDSSRAIVLLVDPAETGRRENDPSPLDKGTYPAFVLAEFSLARREDARELDCIGFFRKQEMRYWWPINVAELRQLQREVAEAVQGPHRVDLGRLVTVTAIALYGNRVPRVAVTQLDRLVESPSAIWHLAAAVSFPQHVEADTATDWRRVLDELRGAGRGGSPIPILGHELLLEELKRFAEIAPDSAASSVAEVLERLCAIYRALRDSPIGDEQSALIVPAVDELRGVVEKALGGG